MKKSLFLFLITVWLTACVSAHPTPSVMVAQPLTPSSKPTRPKPTDIEQPRSTSTISPNATNNQKMILWQVSQIQENISGIVLSGDVAFVGLDHSVVMIDICQHENLRIISQRESLPGDVSLVLIIPGDPDPLLLVNADGYLVILDVSTQNMFTSIQQLELTGSLTAMIFDPQSNILYAGGKIEKNIGFISAIEITPERQKKVIQSIDMPEFPLSLGLAEGSLFFGAEGYQGGLYLILILLSMFV